jgi:acyl carrier protein
LESPLPDRSTHERPKLDTEYVAPQGESETRLAEIWQSFLGIEKIGVRDNFFELGGDSLLATRVYAQIREEFAVELPISKMFGLATLRRLSLYISIARDPGLIDSLPEEDLKDCLAAMEA